jgi:hypothetical protein
MTMLTQATACRIIDEIAKPAHFKTASEHFAFTTREIEVLMGSPVALSVLMDHHEEMQSEAESIFDSEDCPRGNEIRRQALYERGRSIIGADLDIWPDQLCKDFGFPPAKYRR